MGVAVAVVAVAGVVAGWVLLVDELEQAAKAKGRSNVATTMWRGVIFILRTVSGGGRGA
jgi:hypothetical protein